jgi:hypothetical protein
MQQQLLASQQEQQTTRTKSTKGVEVTTTGEIPFTL